jgi:hypothetical protein
MPVSAAIRNQLRTLAGGDEPIDYVFPATGGTEVFFVVTRSAIVLVGGGWLRRDQPRQVIRRFPRGVRLGPVETSGIPSFAFDGIRFEIDDEFVAVLNAADADLAPDSALPPDPLEGI